MVSGLITNVFSAMQFDKNPFTCQREKERERKKKKKKEERGWVGGGGGGGGLRVSNFALLLVVFK